MEEGIERPDIRSEAEAALDRVRPHVLRTPLRFSPTLSRLTGGEVFLKLESEQLTGSFKVRGAVNKILWLSEQDDRRPIVTASTGNHGLGVATALRLTGREGLIVVPEGTSETKLQGLRALGASLDIHGKDCYVSETYARRLAERQGLVYISPYNDPQVIGGQGTVGLEILEQMPDGPDNLFVTIGGGGLISGIGSVLKGRLPHVKLYGCQPARSPEMTLSVRARQYTTVPSRETLSDASAGPFEEDSITYPLCQQLVDDYFLVEEEDIARGIRWMLDHERKLIEGSAAVALAPLLLNPERWAEQRSVVVLCGGNISRDKLHAVLATPYSSPT